MQAASIQTSVEKQKNTTTATATEVVCRTTTHFHCNRPDFPTLKIPKILKEASCKKVFARAAAIWATAVRGGGTRSQGCMVISKQACRHQQQRCKPASLLKKLTAHADPSRNNLHVQSRVRATLVHHSLPHRRMQRSYSYGTSVTCTVSDNCWSSRTTWILTPVAPHEQASNTHFTAASIEIRFSTACFAHRGPGTKANSLRARKSNLTMTTVGFPSHLATRVLRPTTSLVHRCFTQAQPDGPVATLARRPQGLAWNPSLHDPPHNTQLTQPPHHPTFHRPSAARPGAALASPLSISTHPQ